MTHWKRNLAILCLNQLLVTTAFSAYVPLVPYYMQELGASSVEAAATWTAFYNTGAAVAMMVAAPVWGSLGDRHGRKLMLGRATLAGAVVMFLMYMVRSPAQFVAVRIAQGFLGGTIAAASTLVSTETPEEHMGFGLGLLQTTQFAAHGLGPLLGGAVADALGLRAVFPLSGGMMTVAFVIVAVLVRERAQVLGRQGARRGAAAGWRSVLTPSSATLLVLMAAVGFGMTILSPVLSLYIQVLSPDNPRIATLAGAITSAAAITSTASALIVGRLGDRLGGRTVLMVCTAGAAVLYVGLALVRQPMHILLLRAGQGLFTGGIVPTVMALLARATNTSRRGTMIGMASGARAAGRVIGPLVGAGTANAWGMPSVFLMAAGVYAGIAVLAGALIRVAEGMPAPAASAALAEGKVIGGGGRRTY